MPLLNRGSILVRASQEGEKARVSSPAVFTDSSQPPPPVNRGRSYARAVSFSC